MPFKWNYRLTIDDAVWTFCSMHTYEAIQQARKLGKTATLGKLSETVCAICKERVTWGKVFDDRSL